MFSQSIGNVHRGFRNWRSVFYAGDQWKARQNLSLSFGLHFAAVTAPTEVNGLNPPTYPCDCNNFSRALGSLTVWEVVGVYCAARMAFITVRSFRSPTGIAASPAAEPAAGNTDSRHRQPVGGNRCE